MPKIIFNCKTLDSHKMTSHSSLVAVSNIKAKTSTSKTSICALECVPSAPKVCNHCNEIFPDDIALLKHSYDLLPEKTEDDIEVDASEENSIPTIISCEICACFFKYKDNYLSHMKNQHGVESEELPDPAVINLQCRFCPYVASNKTKYNKHICNCHNKFYTKKVKKDNSDQFKCGPCNISFLTAYSEKIHRALYHPDISKIRTHPSLEGEEAKMNFFSTLRLDCRRLIPKSTLFSCDKCQIHFLSYLAACEHSKKCALRKGDWKCAQCRLSFKIADREAHLKQHEVSDRLKVIKVQEGILDRILCRCLSCTICYDEKNLLKYHSFGCSNNNSVACSVCPVHINEYAIKKHVRLHSELGPNEHFVIIDFIPDNKRISKALPEERTPRKRKLSAVYYYCPSCELCMKINRISDNHATGNCNKFLPQCFCKLCGLRFTVKGYQSHVELHKRLPNLKLSDIKFRNIQTGVKIDPPFPDFKKCKKCKVCFFSTVALRSHICYAEEVKICDYCGEKLSDLAYKLHIPFHEYRKQKKLVNELLKKYESLKSIWNILYLCVTCDTILDNYDDVVEHAQDHFCKIENYNVIINHCDICDLRFMGKSYERHEYLHAGDISKNSFEIIKFNHETLLSDKWLDIFITLDPEQVDQILKKSIYKDTRSARMTALDPKDTEFRLYQCGVCKVMVESNKIIDHTHNRTNCVKTANITCILCQFKFDSKNALRSHLLLHENLQIDAMAFKIISFNNEKDAFVNDSLKSVMNPEALKFIRCLHCKKLIKKVKYNKHMIYHRYSDRKKQENMKKPKFVVLPKFKNAGIAPNLFYKCKLCGVCVLKQNIKIHYCSKNSQKKQCKKCLLWFRASHIPKHNLYHEKYNFTKGVNVVSFKNGVIESKSIESKSIESISKESNTVLYQCKGCKACLHWKHNIPRHNCRISKYLRQCNLCKASFHSSHFNIHEKLHDTKSFSKEDVIIMKFTPPSNIKNLTKALVPVKLKNNEANRFLKETSFKKHFFSKKLNRNLRENGDRTNFELIDRTSFRYIYNRLFKCEKCKILFLTGSALVNHAKCCDKDRDSVKCKCGLLFHSSALKLHQKWQRCGKLGETECYIVTLISENIVDFDLRKCLYTCRECDIYFLTFNTATVHYEQRQHDTYSMLYKCEQCNIHFSANSLNRHNKIHHETLNWTLSDLNIFEVKYMTMTQIMNDFPEDSIFDENFASTANDTSSERKSVKRKSAEEPVVANKVLKIGTQTVSEDFTGNLENSYRINIELYVNDFHEYVSCRLFKCEKCKVLFLTGSALVNHAKFCDKDRDSVKCKCGLLFHSSALKLHKYWQRCGKSGLKDYFIVTLTSENIVDFKLRKCLYTCWKCDLYFVTLNTALMHSKGRHYNAVVVECEQCNINFTAYDRNRHNNVHHKTHNWSLSDLIIFEVKYMTTIQIMNDFPEDSICNESFTSTANDPRSEKKSVNGRHVEKPVVANKVLKKGPNTWSWSGTCDMTNIYKCHICDLSFLHKNTLSTHCIVDRHCEHRIKCICGLSFTAKSLRRHLDAPSDVPLSEIEKFITSFKKDELNESQNDEVTQKTGNTLKLFKCSECDVYFLTGEVCQDHTTNHQVLDPTEYIACKICELQFLCEYLGAHMKTHRDKTFNIEDVMVTELQPDRGTEDTYRAIDRLKSKAVSTTTHFDTEDEKSESVDSSNRVGDE